MRGDEEQISREDILDIASVDRIVHEHSRLMIMALLYAVDSADFLYLLRETGLSKGNLSSHLSRLEAASYLKLDKSFRGEMPRTICSLTEIGRSAFRQYRNQLKRTVDRLPQQD